jgi:hypothetical protein
MADRMDIVTDAQDLAEQLSELLFEETVLDAETSCEQGELCVADRHGNKYFIRITRA